MNKEGFLIRLDAARKNADMKQYQVAKELGVDVNTIVAWEKDSSKIPFGYVMKLSKIYHIPINYIFFGSKNEFISNFKKQSTQ